MKKRIFIAGLVCLMLVLLTACGNSEPKNDDTNSSSAPSESVNEETQGVVENSSNTDSDGQSQTENGTHQEYIMVSLQAVEGAVIYDTEYDANGFPISCQFHKKCESCGYVSNNNGQARGNLTTSYHCEKCGNNQHVEIAASFDWVDVKN